ncbi:MAG: glutaredoxin family protein [Candidatus Zambryskibacteria bacterium]|nr:glutaredoxin family protein [Candidatus Zambryskibacteria bacterium]
MKKVVVYSTPTCHFCNLAKDYLKENNIPFESFDVSTDREKQMEIFDKTGQMGVPVILIDDEVIVGFDKPRIEELLKGGAKMDMPMAA